MTIPFAFVSGNAALDLAGTRKWRNDSSPEELLREPADLQRWFVEAEDFPSDMVVTRRGFDSALALREAVYRLACDRLRGERFDDTQLAIVNDLASQPGLRVQLTPTGRRIEGTVEDALTDISRSAVAVLSDPEVSLKECGRATCTRIYVDRSRGARRTWCGMDECGNRVKAAAYRARKRAEANA